MALAGRAEYRGEHKPVKPRKCFNRRAGYAGGNIRRQIGALVGQRRAGGFSIIPRLHTGTALGQSQYSRHAVPA